MGLLTLAAAHDAIPKLLVDPQIRLITPSLVDPGLLVANVAVVFGLVVGAALVTARRALRIDPAEALRSE